MDGLLPTLFASAIFAGLLLAGSFLYWSMRTRDEAAEDELGRRLGVTPAELALRRAKEGTPAARALGGVGRYLHALIVRAGARESVERLLVQSLLFAIVGLVITVRLLHGPVQYSGVIFGVIPWLYLLRQVRVRDHLLTAQLPDALDLICRSLRSGHAFSDALRIAAVEMQPPIAVELALVFEEHRLGLDLRECLDHLVARNTTNFDLRLFASAVLLQRETGGNLIEILENLANTIRERLIFENKVEALTAEVRMSAAILTALPFVVGGIILVLRPGYMAPLYETAPGRSMLVFAGVLMLTGIVLIRRLSRVEY